MPRGIKDSGGDDITVPGSITLVHTLLQMGLLDELRLMVHPIVLNIGIRLFDGIVCHWLTLTQSQTFATGVLNLTHTPAEK